MQLVKMINGQVSVSHRTIANHTDKKAQNIKEIIDDNISDFEEFGAIRFETEMVKAGKGSSRRITYFLNEQQYSLLMTYLRNNAKVKAFKKNMVKAFFIMRNQLENPHNNKDQNLKKVIAGLKSGMTKKDKVIERLKRELDQYKYEQIALPNFSADEKLNIIMKRTDELLSKDTDNYSFTTSLQKHLKFYREYITAIKTGGDEFERFQINQIELARKLKNDAETREMNLYVKYNDMISRIKGFIKASNQIALLEPLEEVKPV